MIAIAVAIVIGLIWGLRSKKPFFGGLVRVLLFACILAGTKWGLLQFQSDLFAPDLSSLRRWMVELALVSAASFALGRMVQLGKQSSPKELGND